MCCKYSGTYFERSGEPLAPGKLFLKKERWPYKRGLQFEHTVAVYLAVSCGPTINKNLHVLEGPELHTTEYFICCLILEAYVSMSHLLLQHHIDHFIVNLYVSIL